ncbi:TOBE domain-containing protein [Reyranella soli]|uniref:Transport-associated OB type 2 domain-containing protein n=1 Tax=Reyranella soli TaxID=1230389 RepID=A0A512N8C5_9HYPH|nr:TOBE domain-containing protein [Reyranella soli]GEP55235.1 hypothetical protein RSO01_24010 [Reyranella soli]
MNKGKLEQVGTPADIYERPASRFVAQFVGWCSLVDGIVDGKGNFVSGHGLAFKSGLPPGAATAVIRPEHVRASGPDPVDAHPAYTAKIISSDYYGGISRLSLSVCGEQLMMDGHFPEDRRPRAGDEIAITLEAAHIRTIPVEPAT